MSKKEAFIFDFFDVIYQDPLKKWSKDHSIAYEDGISDIAFRLDTGAISYQQYLAELAALNSQTVEQLEAEFAEAKLNQEMVDFIKHLKQDYRIGLLSNTNHEEIDPIFKRYNLPSLFHEIVISSDTGLAKPDPAIYKILLAKLHVQPETVIYIDDSPKNVTTAINLSMNGIVYTNMITLHDNLKELGVDY